MHEQQPTLLRDSLAVRHETIRDALAIRDELRTHGQSIVHAGFAALLIVGGLASDGSDREAKQRERKNSADFHHPLLAIRRRHSRRVGIGVVLSHGYVSQQGMKKAPESSAAF